MASFKGGAGLSPLGPVPEFNATFGEKVYYDANEGYNPVFVGNGPSGMPDEYQRLFDANPYRNLSYNKTGFQTFLSNLGFRTKYDDFREQAEINAREYDAGIYSMMQQNQYNSPVEQAQRMRSAGLNPDLLGTGDVANAASPSEDPNGMPAQDSSQEFGQAISALQTFAGGFSDIIAGAMSMMKTFQDIGFQRLRNDELIAGIAEDDVFKSIPAKGFETQEDFDNWIALQNNKFEDGGSEFFKLRNIPKNLRSRYTQVYLRSLNNLPTDIAYYKSKNERMRLRKESSMLSNSKYYTEESDEALGDILEPLIKLSDRVTELEAKVAVKVAENASHEQEIVSSELENRGIEADIRGQELDFLNSQNYGVMSASAKFTEMMVGKLIAETQNEIISRLRKSSQDGSRLAKCLEYQMVLSKFYNWNPYEVVQHAIDNKNENRNQVMDTFGRIASMFILKK